MTEAIEFHKEGKCFLCNEIFNINKGEISLLFEKRINDDGIENCSLADILSSIFSRALSKEYAHSRIICQKCAEIIQEFEVVEQRYHNLKYDIIRKFNKSAKENNIPEVDIGDDDNIVYDNEIDDEFTATAIEYREFDEIEKQNVENEFIESEENRLDEVYQIVQNDEISQEISDGNNIKQMAITISSNDVITTPAIIKSDYVIQGEEQSDQDQVFEHKEEHTELMQNDEVSEVHFDQIIGQTSNTVDTITTCITSPDNSVLDNNIQGADENTTESYTNKIENLPLFNDALELSVTNSKRRKRKIKEENISYTKPVYAMKGEKMICLLCCNSDQQDESTVEFDVHTISIHLKTVHMIRIYICEICGEEFPKRNEMNDHIDIKHSGTDDGEFHCEICNRMFTNLRLFRVHKRLHNNTTKQFACTLCSKKYISKNLLEEHMNTHTGQRPYKCCYCPKNFASKYTLAAHLKTHQDRPRPYACKLCPKAFFSSQNLQQHEKIHSGIKNFICSICNKAFGTQHNLDVHKIVHSGYKPHVCRVCGKAFARRAEIKDHERVHTGEKPFSCNICNLSFAQRSNLTTHKRVTHLNDKRFKCEQCNKLFKRRRLLDYHIRAVHTGERPYKCDVCSASFVYPEHFKKHQRIHSGEKPYACEVCGKTFNSRDNRNAHRFVHSDKKPYECLICGQGFMRKPLLYGHMQQAGHINDTIVVNQPRISKEGELLKFNEDEELLNQENQEIVEEHLIVDGITMNDNNSNENIIPTEIFASQPSIITEIITPDQISMSESDKLIKSEDSGPMQIIHVANYACDKEQQLTWVSFVDGKNCAG